MANGYGRWLMAMDDGASMNHSHQPSAISHELVQSSHPLSQRLDVLPDLLVVFALLGIELRRRRQLEVGLQIAQRA